jgi:hypothetical protein
VIVNFSHEGVESLGERERERERERVREEGE